MLPAEPVGKEACRDGGEHVSPEGSSAYDTKGCLVRVECGHERGDEGPEYPALHEVEDHAYPSQEKEKKSVRPAQYSTPPWYP